MFCFSCGTQVPDQARFCSSCGTQLAGSVPSSSTQASPAPSLSSPPVAGTPQQQYHPGSPQGVAPIPPSPVYAGPPSNALVAGNQPTAVFQRVAAAVFHALDSNIQPQRTGALEVTKMVSFRTIGGLAMPPYYAEYVLPIYAQVIPIEVIPGARHAGGPVVSWSGWHQFLLQKLLVEPQQVYLQLTRVCAAFSLPFTFSPADFPPLPNPVAQAKEQRFRTEIYTLAQRSLSGGGGFGLFGGGGQHGSTGGKISHAAAHAMLKMAMQGGGNMLNGGMGFGGGAGAGFIAPFPGFNS
ncbi:hypothetical protein BX600DRAFT_472549 [Xylariales sp. PMI_506]|nr:hypothetical protein BX600DRAFT_472549 [Xylariales sp. PMI_506]